MVSAILNMILVVSYLGYDTLGIFIERPRLERFLRAPGRRLLYGRRKTGKTFYARHVLNEYQYFIVRRGGMIYDPVEDQEFDLGSFLRICRSQDGIVLDEFHRAPLRLYDAVQAGVCGENLVFITSTLHYHRRFTVEPGAPLKGLFASRMVGLLSPAELLRHRWEWNGKVLVERLVFYQEPAVVGWRLEDIVLSGRDFARSLVGEVLEEENVTYTARFNAILQAIASGKNRLSEIASHLHARGLLPDASTSRITKYVDMLVKMGLIERVEVWGKKKGSIYRHVSPLTETIYYLGSRYGFFDLPLTWRFIEKVLANLIPLLVERFVERLFAETRGLKPVKILSPEIDVALAEFKRIKLVCEVKWSRRVSRSDVRLAEAKLSRFEDAEAILVVPDQTAVPETGLEVWDIRRLIEEARKLSP